MESETAQFGREPSPRHQVASGDVVERYIIGDSLFYQLLQLQVGVNYLQRTVPKPSVPELVENSDLVSALLGVNTKEALDEFGLFPEEFRHVGLDDLVSLLVREDNRFKHIGADGKEHAYTDGGYYAVEGQDGLCLSKTRHSFEEHKDAILAHNGRSGVTPVRRMEQLKSAYLPADFSAYDARELNVGTRTLAALASALAGDNQTRTYLLKQTVYDGGTSKACVFDNKGLRKEFFLYHMTNGHTGEIKESFHPTEPVVGVLRVYHDGPTKREQYVITPSDIGLSIPSPSSDASL